MRESLKGGHLSTGTKARKEGGGEAMSVRGEHLHTRQVYRQERSLHSGEASPSEKFKTMELLGLEVLYFLSICMPRIPLNLCILHLGEVNND